jgi:hypothetical protein
MRGEFMSEKGTKVLLGFANNNEVQMQGAFLHWHEVYVLRCSPGNTQHAKTFRWTGALTNVVIESSSWIY